MVTKQQLIAQIEDLVDDEILSDIAQIIQFHTGREDVYHFTEKEMELIRMAELDIENGNLHDHHEVEEISKSWFRN